MSIFKAYDIRGIVPDQLDAGLARNIGRAYGIFLGKGPVVVGHDMRESSPQLVAALIEGVCETGLDVVDIGQCSTPMLNFGVAHGGHAGGVMVTASHNPGRYNGFKICREQGIPLSGETGIEELRRWVEEESAGFRPLSPSGKVHSWDLRPDYRELLLGRITRGPRPLKVAVDGGNGMIGYFEYGVLAELFPDSTGIYLEPDGRFPNHEANPLVEKNLDDLKKFVTKIKADVGIAFDGDGDRVVFVDEQGRTAMADLVLALLAPSMLARQPGSPILYDLRSSRAVGEEIAKAGGKPVLSRVGHAFIKKTLRENEGIIGGELSGHFYFRDFHYLDSGILGALRLLELLSHETRTFSELLAPIDRYPRTGEINFQVEDPDRMLEHIETSYRAHGKVFHLDGFSFESETFWFNLRKSNTEPLLRLNLQAIDPEVLKIQLEDLEKVLGQPVDH